MKWRICLLAMLWPFINTFAQSAELQIPPGGLQIGDKVPDVTIENIINYPGGSANISDFKDKLLIIDFGNTRCAPCIVSQDKMAAIEKKFNGRFKLLAVSYEPKEQVKKFAEKRNWSFSYATEDTLLKKLFPHFSVPHLVWIKNNQVLAITNAYDATEENIRNLIQGEDVEFTLKRDRKYDRSERITDIDPAGKTTFFYSHLSGYQYGMGTNASWKQMNNGNIKFAWINIDAIGLILDAYKGKEPYYLKHRNRLRVAVSDSLMRRLSMMYKLPKTDGTAQNLWVEKHGISYEIESPLDRDKIAILMQQELNTFFRAHYGIEASVEKRKVKCLALLRTGGEELFRSEGGKPISNFKNGRHTIQNVPMRWFVTLLLGVHRNYRLPIVDRTDFHGNVDFILQRSTLKNIRLLNHELKKYGLKLQEKILKIDMLIIRQLDDKGNPVKLKERSLLPYYGIES